MPPQLPDAARAAADKAREVYAKVRPADPTGQRALPIRATAEEIQARWADADGRTAVLAGLPTPRQVSIAVGPQDRDWGRTVTLSLELEEAVPGVPTHVLAGKALRRLKALVETGEVPTTARNPSAREDAGQEAVA